jgi:2-keto-3-deoxy-L-rhamnonate aldolase RhmA
MTGLDWLFLDMEHSAMDLHDIKGLLQAMHTHDCFAVVRTPDSSDTAIKRILDMGCDAIVVPQVNSVEQAKAVVDSAKYAPMGKRSVGIGRAHGYGQAFIPYIQRANTDISVIIQVEHVDAVNNIDAILDIPGIDGVFIGPYDLSASLNCIGDLQNELVQNAIATTKAAAIKRNIPLGIYCPTAEAANTQLSEGGMQFVAVGIDTGLLVTTVQNICENVAR